MFPLILESHYQKIVYTSFALQWSFIAFFDQDDISHPARISLQFQRYCEARRRISSAVPLACYCAGKKYYNGSNWLPILPIGQGVNIVDAKILVRSTLVRESREIDLEVGSGTPCATAFFAVFLTSTSHSSPYNYIL